jgi:hypothetical protein
MINYSVTTNPAITEIETSTTDGAPGFEVPILIFSIASLVVIVRRKQRN